MPTFSVILTDRRDDASMDPESQLCTAVSLREALNRVRAYAVQHTEANLTGVQIVQDGVQPRLAMREGRFYLVVARLADERDDQACPVILLATRELADQFIDEEIVASEQSSMRVEVWDQAGRPGPPSRTLFAIQDLPLVTSLATGTPASPVPPETYDVH